MKIEKVECPYGASPVAPYIKFTKHVGKANSLDEVRQYLERFWLDVSTNLAEAVWDVDLSGEVVDKPSYTEDPGAIGLRGILERHSTQGAESRTSAMLTVLKSISVPKSWMDELQKMVIAGHPPVATNWAGIRLEYFEIENGVPNYSNERYSDVIVNIAVLSSLVPSYTDYKSKQ